MISKWENELNVSPRQNGMENIMNLESILRSLQVFNNEFELNKDYSTIRYITEIEYKKDVYEYVEPNFYDCDNSNIIKPKFILFSAPGATGKTALAKHICYKKMEYIGICLIIKLLNIVLLVQF